MKRIVALFSAVLMALFAVPSMARAEEATTLTITADKAVANPGDRVTFSLILGAVNNLGGMSLYIDLPEGLSIDYSSVKLPEGVEETLNVTDDYSIPTEKNENIFDLTTKRAGYTGTDEICILTFTCTVDSDSALETKNVGLKKVDVFDNDVNLNTIKTTVQAAQLKVEDAKVPTATPTPEATATPTPEATATPTPEATATPTPEATATPTPEATATPIPEPTATPIPEPTATPAAKQEKARFYLADLEDLVEGVEKGSTIRISKEDDINTLNNNVLRMLNEHGVSLQMEYTYKGRDYKIFIPAGEAVIDEDVFWCGPLYLAGLYGNNVTGIDTQASGEVVSQVAQALKQVIDL